MYAVGHKWVGVASHGAFLLDDVCPSFDRRICTDTWYTGSM